MGSSLASSCGVGLLTRACHGNEIDRWAGYHSGDGFFPMAAGQRVHAALQREKRKIKIVSNESGSKKFLLNWF
jgi:hypothetical protein